MPASQQTTNNYNYTNPSTFFTSLSLPLLTPSSSCPPQLLQPPFTYCLLTPQGNCDYTSNAIPLSSSDLHNFASEHAVRFNDEICSVEVAIETCREQAGEVCRRAFEGVNSNVRAQPVTDGGTVGVVFLLLLTYALVWCEIRVGRASDRNRIYSIERKMTSKINRNFTDKVERIMKEEKEKIHRIMSTGTLKFHDSDRESAFEKHLFYRGVWVGNGSTKLVLFIIGVTAMSWLGAWLAEGLPEYRFRIIMLFLVLFALLMITRTKTHRTVSLTVSQQYYASS